MTLVFTSGIIFQWQGNSHSSPQTTISCAFNCHCYSLLAISSSFIAHFFLGRQYAMHNVGQYRNGTHIIHLRTFLYTKILMRPHDMRLKLSNVTDSAGNQTFNFPLPNPLLKSWIGFPSLFHWQFCATGFFYLINLLPPLQDLAEHRNIVLLTTLIIQ